VLALSEAAPLALLVSAVPVAEPETVPLALLESAVPVAEPETVPLALLVSAVPVAVPLVSTVPVADPVALTVSVVLTVSVETCPVSGPVFTFAWFLEQAASETAATKAKTKRIAYPSCGVPAGYCRVAHE
jgi:hypothetical protein